MVFIWVLFSVLIRLSIIMATVPTIGNNDITTIKYFRFLRTFYQDSDIFSPQIKLYGALSAKVWWILFIFTHFTLASVAFLFFKANTIGERAYSYYTTVTLIFCLSYFICNALKMPKIEELIENFDEFIRKSTFKLGLLLPFIEFSFIVELFSFLGSSGTNSNDSAQKYSELNAKIERFSKLAHFGTMHISVLGIIVSASFMAVVKYVFYNLGSDSFYLPIPLMYGRRFLLFVNRSWRRSTK